MSATTLSIVTATKAGATVTATAVASSDTITISCTTAESAIDFSSLFIRFYASTVAVFTLAASSTFSEKGQGTLAVSVASLATVIFGGQDFESARFLNHSAGTITFTVTSGTGSVEAYQYPRATE